MLEYYKIGKWLQSIFERANEVVDYDDDEECDECDDDDSYLFYEPSATRNILLIITFNHHNNPMLSSLYTWKHKTQCLHVLSKVTQLLNGRFCFLCCTGPQWNQLQNDL